MKRNVIKEDKNIQCSLGKNPSINIKIKKITETSIRRTGFVPNIPNTKDYNLKEVNRKKLVNFYE